MSTAENMYALDINQIANLIALNGHNTTLLVEGDTGCGKSSIPYLLKETEQFKDHIFCYFDGTIADTGDLTIPHIMLGTPEETASKGYVRYLTNEMLGMHHNKPVLLMLDEVGKANRSVRNGLMRTMLERKMGAYSLHPDSVVFGTTNLGAEGLGDMFEPHQRDRVTSVRMRKPDAIQWIEWGINHDVDHAVLGWVKDNPHVMQSFTEVANPEDNPYIYHPKDASRKNFVTPRSLERASKWLKVRQGMDHQSLTAALIGTIGPRAAMDMMAFVTLADKLPSTQSIKDDPSKAIVPDSAAGICMVVFRTLGGIDRTWMDQWMDYMERMPLEAQGMFVNGVRQPKYKHQSVVMTNKKFSQWALKNNFLFSADRK